MVSNQAMVDLLGARYPEAMERLIDR